MPDATVEQQPTFIRHENFESWYTNNIQYHPSEWDLKLIFGELDWRDGNMVVQQHTAMSMAWLQVKIMHYFLTLQLGIYELAHGRISVPPSVAPIEPPRPTGQLENDELAHRIHEFIKNTREQFMAAQD
jgi:hypothetical protein